MIDSEQVINRVDSSTEKISLESLAELTGFPLELIQKELFVTDAEVDEGLSLEDLRAKMLRFLDSNISM